MLGVSPSASALGAGRAAEVADQREAGVHGDAHRKRRRRARALHARPRGPRPRARSRGPPAPRGARRPRARPGSRSRRRCRRPGTARSFPRSARRPRCRPRGRRGSGRAGPRDRAHATAGRSPRGRRTSPTCGAVRRAPPASRPHALGGAGGCGERPCRIDDRSARRARPRRRRTGMHRERRAACEQNFAPAGLTVAAARRTSSRGRRPARRAPRRADVAVVTGPGGSGEARRQVRQVAHPHVGPQMVRAVPGQDQHRLVAEERPAGAHEPRRERQRKRAELAARLWSRWWNTKPAAPMLTRSVIQ